MLEHEKEYFKHVDRSPQNLQIEAVPEHQAQPTSAAADQRCWLDLESCPGIAALLLSADRQTHGLIADAVPHRKVADEEHSAPTQCRMCSSDKRKPTSVSSASKAASHTSERCRNSDHSRSNKRAGNCSRVSRGMIGFVSARKSTSLCITARCRAI